MKDLFHRAMLVIFDRAKRECDFDDTRFLDLVVEEGGLGAARALLHTPGLSEEYATLRERKRLDLTMEALIVENPQWRELFTDAEIAIAEKKLNECGYIPRR